MPVATVAGVELYYEVTGSGDSLVFSHEFAGDHRSWAPQVAFFARHYQVLTYSNRGYPPSSVPADPAAYAQEHLIADLHGLLGQLGITRAHLVGLSMGSHVVLNFALAYPEVCRSIVVAGCGVGSDDPEQFRREGQRLIAAIEAEGMAAFAARYAVGPTRQQLARKDPLGWQRFRDQLAEHSTPGSALTFANVQLKRPTVYDLAPRLADLALPVLIVAGDEDEGCLAPGLFLKRQLRGAGLALLPATGHTVNLEEPEAFNRLIFDFLAAVEHGRWPVRERPTTSQALF